MFVRPKYLKEALYDEAKKNQHKASRFLSNCQSSNKATRKIGIKKTALQWVYATGSAWVTLNKNSQKQNETLWSRDSLNWIHSSSFRGPVYVDTSKMLLMSAGLSYAIARRRN